MMKNKQQLLNGMTDENNFQDSETSPRLSECPAIWVVGSGEKGAGKSFVASSLGVMLAKRGKRVLLVDADFSRTNLHKFVKCERKKYSLLSFLAGEVPNMTDLIGKTTIPNLDMIHALNESQSNRKPKKVGHDELHKMLVTMEYDYVLIDAGHGTSPAVLDLFLMSDFGIVVTRLKPTSIDRTYKFIKALFLRHMKHTINLAEDDKLKSQLKSMMKEKRSNRPQSVADLFKRLNGLKAEKIKPFQRALNSKDISLVINQTRKPEDRDVGAVMSRACENAFGMRIDYLGHIVDNSPAPDKKPAAVHDRQSEITGALKSILQELLSKEKKRIKPLRGKTPHAAKKDVRRVKETPEEPAKFKTGHGKSGNKKVRCTLELKKELVVMNELDLMATELYRNLFTKLEEVRASRSCKVIGVTSAAPQEGKTSTVMNLAYLISHEFDKKVVIVECDMKRPSITASFIKQWEGNDLVDVLCGKASLNEAMAIFKNNKNLYLLPTRQGIRNSTKLIKAKQMNIIIDELRNHFDYIIFDCPPVMPLADMNVITKIVDGLIFVIKAGITPKDVVMKGAASLDEEKVIGTILNGVDISSHRYYYNYYH
ncbi:MAG: polysaccharide biosynthesis tyrosine autokinase [Proteobacteria bacterium]|nr:polysaccharide biosynthesis tyrosine autokinase [Pseudomonadota bacterium]